MYNCIGVCMRKLKKFFKIVRTGNLSYFLNRLQHKKYLIQFVPTVRCNLRCKMCHQKDIRLCCEQELSFNEVDKMLKNLKKLGVNQLNLVGGELFVRGDAWLILDKIEEMGFLFSIATNATLLTTSDVEKLSYYWGLMEIDVSLDGPDCKTHDKIRGVPGVFDKTIEFIKDCKNFDIIVMVVTVVQKDNYKKLCQIADLIESMRVDTWTLCQEFSVSEDTFKKTKVALEKLSGHEVDIFASYSVRGNTFEYNLEDFKKKIREVKEYCELLKLNTNFAFDIDKFDEIYNETCRENFVCSCSDFAGQIDWQGNLNFCPFIRVNGLDKAHGLFCPGFLESNDLCKLKDSVLKMNMMPFCERCCGLKMIKSKKS